jgi:hypothetical protein
MFCGNREGVARSSLYALIEKKQDVVLSGNG